MTCETCSDERLIVVGKDGKNSRDLMPCPDCTDGEFPRRRKYPDAPITLTEHDIDVMADYRNYEAEEKARQREKEEIYRLAELLEANPRLLVLAVAVLMQKGNVTKFWIEKLSSDQ